MTFCRRPCCVAIVLFVFLFAIFLFTGLTGVMAETNNTSGSGEMAPLFPFVLSADAPDNVVNIATWNETPAGKYGFVRVDNGRFVHDGGRLLIWGTNTCFSANFPEKEQAERIAARLARFGFNCVRLHHMDSRDIWSAGSLTKIDPVQLDKLDYYIYQLKKHGIYTNLNLHVSRWLDDRDGFPNRTERPNYDKGLDNFYPPLIDSQKKYAADLLNHVNPYTKTSYREEPAISMIEINNENSVVAMWSWGDSLLTMPDPYRADFQKRWNSFLRKKYRSTAELAASWKCINEPFGAEMLRGNSPAAKWNMEVDSETRATKSDISDTTDTSDTTVMRVAVDNKGNVAWHPQLNAPKLSFEAGKLYTFSVEVRGDKPATLTIGTRMAHEPWETLGFNATMKVDTSWKKYDFTFIPSVTDIDARFDIGSFQQGMYEFRSASLRTGGVIGLTPDQTLEKDTIPLVSSRGSGTLAAATNDFCEFLLDIENSYWTEMYRFLKEDIAVRQPVSGTQLKYGSTHIQAKLDYLDDHTYWNHPNFPGRSWDGNNWEIRNRAMVNYLDTELYPQMATARVAGKPYTISEIDAPYPNQFSAELLPIMAAFGRFQDWDGIFHFAYNHNKNNLEPQFVNSFFDMAGNTVKLVHQPACVAMFRRGDVAEGKVTILGGFDAKKELSIFQKDKSARNFNFNGLGAPISWPLFHKTALDLSGKQTPNIMVLPVEDTTGYSNSPSSSMYMLSPFSFRSTDTGELVSYINTTTRQDGIFLANTPNTKMITGFVPQKQDIHFTSSDGKNDVKLTVDGSTRLGWTTISMVSMNQNGFGTAGGDNKDGVKPVRILLAATGQMLNTDMKLEPLSGDKITVGNRWGKPPVLCEGIPLTVSFLQAKQIQVFPLDEKGNRRAETAVTGNSVKLGPQYQTVWYEIVVQ